MKYIFDFDDVIFQTTKHRLEHMYSVLEKAGIVRQEIEEYYKRERLNLFSPKKLIKHFHLADSVYEEIMKGSQNFLNKELVKTIEKLGKENCHIVNYGDEEFQLDKIHSSSIAPLFSEIIVVSSGKKEIIEKLCAKHKDEQVFFIDDQIKHFDELDLDKCPNLKTILYTGQKLELL